MLKNVDPFLQNTLVQELTRDFFKKENDLFFVQAAGNATGTGSEAANMKNWFTPSLRSERQTLLPHLD